jgi:hypothetical protein
MAKFQPWFAARWKNTHPDRLPVLTRLKTGAGPEPLVTSKVGFAQNSMVNGLVEGGFSAAL